MPTSTNKSNHIKSQFEELAIAALKNDGFRITMARLLVVRALASTSKALSAYEIHDSIIESGGKTDVVSVYRILDVLEKSRLIYRVGMLPGNKYVRRTDSVPKIIELLVVDRSKLMAKESQVPSELVATLKKFYGSDVAERIRIEVVMTSDPHFAAA